MSMAMNSRLARAKSAKHMAIFPQGSKASSRFIAGLTGYNQRTNYIYIEVILGMIGICLICTTDLDCHTIPSCIDDDQVEDEFAIILKFEVKSRGVQIDLKN